MIAVTAIVDGEGRVAEICGDPAALGLELEPGDAAAERAPVLAGLLPLDDPAVSLPRVELESGCVVDVHITTRGRGAVITFVDSAETRDRERSFRQRANVARLDQERSERLESTLAEILVALDTVVIELGESGRAHVMGRAPAWFAKHVGDLDGWLRSPFPHAFLDGLHSAGETGRPLRSGIWTEPTADGAELHLEAAAISIDGRPMLLIERLGEDFEERRRLLQTAREHRLESDAELRDAYDRLERELVERTRAQEGLIRYQTRLRALATELARAGERERRRMATDLHDHVGQLLAAVKIRLGVLAGKPGAESTERRHAELMALVDEIISFTRSLTSDTSPPALYRIGLEAALESLAERCQSLHGLQVTLLDDCESGPLDEDVRVTLYQAVRELVFNVHKHAAATRVEIHVARDDDSVRVEVADDGRGFGATERENEVECDGGFGLFAIREQIDRLGGAVELGRSRLGGAVVRLTLPLTRPAT